MWPRSASSDSGGANLLLHGSSDVGEVVRSEIQEGLHLQFGHLLQDEAVIWQDSDTELESQYSDFSPSVISLLSEQRRHTTFCCVENRSRLSAASLPVDTVRQRAHKILLRRLHDLLTHPVKLGGVVDPTVELGTGVGKFCRRKTKKKKEC